nr:MAG TPA: hypothetical protein [Caudoviricetes sp.]
MGWRYDEYGRSERISGRVFEICAWRSSKPKLKLPFYPIDDEGLFDIPTYWEHLVHEYTGLNVNEIEELEYIDYLQYKRDAFIHSLNQTEEGREYLENAKTLAQTEPDRKALRELFGKGK